MVPAVCLALVLAGPPEGVDARAELDACATRIEELKARRRAGQAAERELERLLVRAQELALELERARDEVPGAAASPPPASPSPEELRESADAARDEADRLSAEIAELDVKLGDARRIAQADSDPTLRRAVVSTCVDPVRGIVRACAASSPAARRVVELQVQRDTLARRRSDAEEAASRLEAEARAAETDR